MKKFTDITDKKECFDLTGNPVVTSLSKIPRKFKKQMIAHYNNMVIAECANHLSRPGEVPDYKNHNQKKWFPWFRILPSGSVAFRTVGYFVSNAYAGDPFRLAFLEEADARHAGEFLNDDCASSITE